MWWDMTNHDTVSCLVIILAKVSNQTMDLDSHEQTDVMFCPSRAVSFKKVGYMDPQSDPMIVVVKLPYLRELQTEEMYLNCQNMQIAF